MLRSTEEAERKALWEDIRRIMRDILLQHAKENPFPGDGFFIVDDDYGFRQSKVIIGEWRLFFSGVLTEINAAVDTSTLSWEVEIIAGMPPDELPPMGVFIRAGRIEDHLIREHVPDDYKKLVVS